MTPTAEALAAYANLTSRIKAHDPNYDVAAFLTGLFNTRVIPSPRSRPTQLMIPGHATLHLIHGTWIGQPTVTRTRLANDRGGE